MPEYEVVLVGGRRYARAEGVLAQLGTDVTPEMLRWWARSGRVRRIWDGRRWWYDLLDAATAERDAAESGRGRTRRGTFSTQRVLAEAAREPAHQTRS